MECFKIPSDCLFYTRGLLKSAFPTKFYPLNFIWIPLLSSIVNVLVKMKTEYMPFLVFINNN